MDRQMNTPTVANRPNEINTGISTLFSKPPCHIVIYIIKSWC
jgi:hypothetical protein